MIGVSLAVGKFLTEKERERILRQEELKERLESQYRSDLQELLQFAGNKSMSIPQAAFLLEDLTRLTVNDGHKRQAVTKLLVRLIESECDFDQPRDVEFGTVALEYWKGYSKYLQENYETHSFLVYKYFPALRSLHGQDPKYFETIAWEPGFGFRVAHYTAEAKFVHFERLVRGFVKHFELLRDRPKAAEDAKANFVEALNNPRLADALFGGQTVTQAAPR